MVRIEVLQKRLEKIEQNLSILRRYQSMPLDEFLSDHEHYNTAERVLQLSIEATIDMGNHLVADLNLGFVDYSAQIPDILVEKGYLARELAETWVKMIGLRNILVHDYLDVNHRIIYGILQNNLNDLEALKKFFASFI